MIHSWAEILQIDAVLQRLFLTPDWYDVTLSNDSNGMQGAYEAGSVWGLGEV